MDRLTRPPRARDQAGYSAVSGSKMALESLELSHRTVETKNGYRSTYENMFAGYFGVHQGTRVLIYSHMYFFQLAVAWGLPMLESPRLKPRSRLVG